MSDQRPIGVFDSGVGGLTLLNELDSLMPYENFVYIADTKHMPYGTKSEEEVVQYSENLIQFLEAQNCKMVVIACNTVTGLLPEIEKGSNHTIPVVGIINFGSMAAALYVTYSFNIGVWATKRTIDSGVYRKFMESFDPTVNVFMEPCTELIPMIEEGKVGSPEIRKLTEQHLARLMDAEVDTLILGCTHLPYIKTIIQDIVTPAVTLIDPARRTAALCMKVLKDKNLLRSNHTERGIKKFFVTGDPESFHETTKLLLGRSLGEIQHAEVG